MRKLFLVLMLMLSENIVSSQTFNFVKQVGSSGNEFCNAIDSDSLGNIYVAGYFYGTVDFDPGAGIDSHISAGGRDAFVMKLDIDGNKIWAQTWGGGNDDTGNGIAVDEFGNVFISGRFQGTADFDPGTETDMHKSNAGTANNPFLVKYDADGNLKWAKTWGGTYGAEGYTVTVDKDGYIYMAGDMSNPVGADVDFDPGPDIDNHSVVGFFDAWLVKYDTNGNYIWGKMWGGTQYDDGPSVTTDNAGAVYVAGMFMSQPADFDPGPGEDLHSSNGNIDVFVSKFDSKGNHLWTKTWGSTGEDDGGQIIADKNGHLYVTGYFAKTVDFNPGNGIDSIKSAGEVDIFISKLDTAGNYIWAKRFGGTGEDRSFSIEIDNAGNIYSTGYFKGTSDFDPGPEVFNLNANNGFGTYLCVLDSSGKFVWANAVSGTADIKNFSFKLVDNFKLYSVGTFSGTADFDTGTANHILTAVGGSDIFISRNDLKYTVESTVIYDNVFSTPLHDVSLKLIDSDGKNVAYTKTDINGYYNFINIPNGTYTIEASSDSPVGDINSIDALLANKNYLGTYDFKDDFTAIAADVDKSKSVNPKDALMINRFYMQITNSFPAGAWYFKKPSFILNSDRYPQIRGICIGDANASFKPAK